jgi:uracil phosphoribosyltransferase
MYNTDQHVPFPPIDVKQYGGKQVAIVDGKIVATGETSVEVLKQARQEHPDTPLSEIHLVAVPNSIYVMYHA